MFALPLTVALLISVGWVCYNSYKGESSGLYCVYTKRDALKLSVACILAAMFVDMVGFTGHVTQAIDFAVRNPIYHTLVREAWPLFSAKGEYFIYYHSFWLPPAFISKCIGGVISPDIILSLWVLLGVLLFIFLMFTRIRGRVLTLFIVLCLLGNVSELPNVPYRMMVLTQPCKQEYLPLINALHYLGFGSKMRYFHFWGNVVYTFNSALPALICMGLFLSKILSKRYFPIAVALVASASPFCVVALVPFFVMLVVTNGKLLRIFLSDVKVWCCVLLLMACGLYFMGQEASEARFIWSDSESLLRLPAPFRLLSVRLLRYVYIVLGCLIPACLLIRRRLRRNIWFYTFVSLVFFLPLLWIGRHNNEFLFKGSIYLFVIYAWLITEEWRFAGMGKRAVLALFLLVSCLHLIMDAKIRHWADYSWMPEKKAAHIESSWHDTLNNPEEYSYRQFWGTVLQPDIQYSIPGESFIK